MALISQNVRVAVTGGVYRADLGTTLPTSALSALGGDFEDMGYISEEGVTQSIARDVTNIAAWQNGDVVRTVQTSHIVTYTFTLIESKDEVFRTIYGNFTDLGGGEGVSEITGDILDSHAWVLNVIDGTNRIRLCIPDGQVTETGDITWTNGELIGYPVTVTTFPDGDGVKAYKYLATSAGS